MTNFIEYPDGVFCLNGTKSSNIYFIKREQGVLIDTGHPDMAEYNLSKIIKFGIKPQDVQYIINTHSHPDHVGGNAYFRKKYFIKTKIINSFLSNQYILRRKHFNFYPDLEDSFDTYPIDKEVKNGDYIDLGNDKLKIYATPGHSIDSISIELLSNHSLFAGDLLYPNIITQVDYYYDVLDSLNQLIKTYKQLQTFSFSRVYPGHGKPIEHLSSYQPIWEKKLTKFKNNPSLLLVNNSSPILELFFQKNPRITEEKAISILEPYLQRPINAGICNSAKNFNLKEILEKTILIMNAMGIIQIEENQISLTGELNQRLG